MEAKIQINYNEVDIAARRYVEYVGSKGVAADYERIMLQEEDSDWFDEMHEEMMSELMSVLETWSVRETNTDNGKEVVLYIPDNARSTVKDNVQRKSFAFCVSYVESRWLKIAGNELADVRATEASVHLRSIRSIMTHRRPPIRRTMPNPWKVVGYTTGEDADVKVEVTYED